MEDVRTGYEVYCGADKVGSVARLVADSSDSHITDIVVDRGLFHGAKIIPIGQLKDVRSGQVQLTLSRDAFERADGFGEQRFTSPEDNWSAPPGYDPSDFLLNAEVAMGSGGGYAGSGKASPFPPSPPDPRPNLLRPVAKEGTPVRSAEGEKVGEIASMSFHPDDGRLTAVVLKRGLLGQDRAELPLDWIADLNEEGLNLRVDAAEVQRL